MESLRKFIRVLEFDEYLEERFGGQSAEEPMFVDQILYLQQFPFDGNWESRIKQEECKERNNYEMDDEGNWRGNYLFDFLTIPLNNEHFIEYSIEHYLNIFLNLRLF